MKTALLDIVNGPLDGARIVVEETAVAAVLENGIGSLHEIESDNIKGIYTWHGETVMGRLQMVWKESQ